MSVTAVIIENQAKPVPVRKSAAELAKEKEQAAAEGIMNIYAVTATCLINSNRKTSYC